jgi:hypothetical protein
LTDRTALIRSLQPIREGNDIYVEVNGERLKLSPMQASLILQAWAAAVGGALSSARSSLRGA